MATEAGELVVKISADVADIKAKLQEMSAAVGKSGEETVAKGLIIGTTFTEVGKAVIRFGADSVKAYGEQELAVARLAGVVGKDAANAFEEYASELQKQTIYSDESILSLQSQLANFGLLPGSIKEATGALVDYASRTGKDLPEAAQVFGQALAGNSRELRRYGLQILESDDRSTRMNKTIQFMTEHFHGAAEEIKNTTLGQLENFKNRVNELQEKIGKQMVPVLQSWTSWIDKGMNALEKLTGASKNDLTVRQLTIERLKAEQQTLVLALKGYAEYKNMVVATYGVQALNDQFLRERMKSTTDQIKLLKQQEAQETKTHLSAEKGIKQEKSAAEQAVDAKISGLQMELKVAEEMARKQYEITGLVTQKKIADSKMELAQLTADQQFITEMTGLETQKRMEQSAASWEANASFSDQFKLKLQDDMNQNTAAFADMAAGLMKSFADSTAKMIVEGGKFKDVMQNLWKQLAEQVIAQIIRMIAEWLVFQAMTGGGGGILGGFMGGMAEGGMINEPSMLIGMRSGSRHIVGEAGPEEVVPMGQNRANSAGASSARSGGGGGGDIHINISGQFIEGSPSKWNRLVQEQIVPQLRRFSMTQPNGVVNRKRGAMS